jgi:hypothetical protein
MLWLSGSPALVVVAVKSAVGRASWETSLEYRTGLACFKGLHNKSSRDLQPLPIYCTPRSKKVLDLQQNWCAFLECTDIVVAILPLPNSIARRSAQVRHRSARPVRFKEICCVHVKAGLKEYDA